MSCENTYQEINDHFNAQLKLQIDGRLPKGYVYLLGYPNEILLSVGIPNISIELSADRLELKASQENHLFDINNAKDLPLVINNPIAIFNSTKKDDSKVILTTIADGNHHFVAILRVRKGHVGKSMVEVNSIRSLYPKNNIEGILDWICSKDNLLLYVNKEKALEFISTQSTNLIAGGNIAKSFYATKIIQNFENPKLPQKNLRHTSPIVIKPKSKNKGWKL